MTTMNAVINTMNESQDNRQDTIIRAWSPLTTRLLSKGGSSAWNILDNAMDDPKDFVPRLRRELQNTGLLEQLKPARTTSDAQISVIMSLLEKQTNTVSLDATPTSRGDRSVFVERSYRTNPGFSRKHPLLAQLIKSIQDTAQSYLSDAIDLDLSRTSVQLAAYPGDGQSGYFRHCDRSGTACQHEPHTSTHTVERIITAVYYLTEDDWDAVQDDGCLRLFVENNKQVDVVPYSNRLVVFRSDCVEHQVLPSRQRSRYAITIWLYGKIRENDTMRKEQPENSFVSVGNKDKKSTEQSVSEEKSDSKGPPPLPVSPHMPLKSSEATIFVSIAAYRDSETGPTLRNLMATARHPSRIHVGLMLQIDTTGHEQYDRERVLGQLPTHEPWYRRQVNCLTLDAQHASGPCPARAMCQLLYRGEDYVLQIDSHMRFRENWDTYLIDELSKCPSNKPVLTAYPVGYRLPNDIPNETRGTVLVPWKFDSCGMLRQRGRLMATEPSGPIACHLFAAGFNFGLAEMWKECPYDGSLHYLFFGEEMSMAVRLYTAGYDLFAPTQSVCYHLWSRSHRPPQFASFDNESTKTELQQASLKLVRDQLRGTGRGLGSVRSAADFANVIGVDFRAQTIVPEAATAGMPEETFCAIAYSDDSVRGKVQSLDANAKRLIASFLSL